MSPIYWTTLTLAAALLIYSLADLVSAIRQKVDDCDNADPFDCEGEAYRDAAGKWRWRVFFVADPGDVVAAPTKGFDSLGEAIADYELVTNIEKRVGTLTVITKEITR